MTDETTTGEMDTMEDQMNHEAAETNVDAETTAAAAPVAEGQAPADLTVQDLQALKVIIDVASQRGAFKANEMAMVGATYNKLEAFLKIVEQSQKDANTPKDDKPTEAK